MKKYLLPILIVICLYTAGTRLRHSYLAHTPFAQVGECISVNLDKDVDFHLRIIENNNSTFTSTLQVEYVHSRIYNGPWMGDTFNGSYQEVREMHPVKIACEE